jgi:peptidoglycan/xylan/chitin deacetylase (PgdA/CDA1 family)
MSWDQIRELDRSGLITIGGHTVNHRNLTELSDDDQEYEIAEGKAQLERQLGHKVRHFAYPYGAHDEESAKQVRLAGYVSAVTVEAGTHHGPGTEYTLQRVRNAWALP